MLYALPDTTLLRGNSNKFLILPRKNVLREVICEAWIHIQGKLYLCLLAAHTPSKLVDARYIKKDN